MSSANGSASGPTTEKLETALPGGVVVPVGGLPSTGTAARPSGSMGELRRRRKGVLQRRSSVERTFVESRARFEKLVSNAQELIGSIS